MDNPLASLDAERSALGGVFVSPVAFSDIAARVSESDFTQHLHRKIYHAMAAMDAANQPIDLLTIAEYLESQGTLADGEWAYIAQIANETPSAANVCAYADIVHNRARQRTLLELGADLQRWALQDRDAEKTLNRLQEALERFSNPSKSAADPVLFKDLLHGAIDAIERRFNGIDARGLETGLSDLDALTLGLQASRLYVVAGRPSMGKSVLGLQLAAQWALQHKQRALFFTAEMPSGEHVERLIASFGRVALDRVQTGKLDESEWVLLTNAITELTPAALWFDDTPAPSLTEILSKTRRLHRQHKLGLVVIDHGGLVTSGGENRTQAQSAVAIGLKALAKELACPVIALVQLNRKLEERSDKRPLMSDLRETGEWEQSADVVAMIYRDEIYNPDSPDKGCAELIIRKQRGGKLGTVPLLFRGEYAKFESLSGGLPSWKLPKSSPRKRGIDL